MADWIKACEEAEKLPPGHVGKKYAKALVQAEYAECHSRMDKYKLKGSLELDQALTLMSRLLGRFGQTRSVRIKLDSKEVQRFTGAHYNPSTRTIHFPDRRIYMRTLLHEFTHFLQCENGYRGGHGEDFCFLQDLVCQEALPLIEGL